jgi:2-hydroxychromene-2-carboxylate isomerase
VWYHHRQPLASQCDLDSDEFCTAIAAGSRYDEELQRCNRQAEADGVFGFPFFVYYGRP